MKRIWLILLAATMFVGLWGCAEEKAAPAVTTEQTTEALQIRDTFEGPAPVDEANGLIGCPVEDLLTLLGAPTRIEYYPSPMSEGTDEQLEEGYYYYDGFVVITLKEGDSETVFHVEENH